MHDSSCRRCQGGAQLRMRDLHPRLILRLFLQGKGKQIFATEKEQFCNEIRQIQRRTGCTEATVIEFLSTFEKFIQCPTEGIMHKSLKTCDRLMQKRAGVQFLILNGCIKCKKFVFLPDDERSFCPDCGGPRFDAHGKAKEV